MSSRRGENANPGGQKIALRLVKVFVQVTCKASPPTLVLIPSLGRGGEDFLELSALLSGLGYQVLVVEPFGMRPEEDIATADLVTLAEHVLRAAPEEAQLVLIGHAFGNWVARMAGTLAPARTLAIVLLAAAKREIPAEIRPSINGSFDPSLSDEERLEHLRRAYFAPSQDARVWVDGWHPALAEGQRAAAARTDRAIWWGAGGVVPILDVQAEHDAIAPASKAHELRDELGPRVTPVIIRDAGHALVPEQPGEVARVIHAFLDGLIAMR